MANGAGANYGQAFGSLGAGVSDLFAGLGAESKAAGDYAEAAEYNLAADWANKEAEYTKNSTAIQEMQESREISKSLGQTTADVAGAGFATSGSAMDLLRDSAQQGALQKQVTQVQGNITMQGYEEQAKSDEMMANAAVMAGNAEGKAATGDFIGAGIQAVAGIASMGLGAGGPASSMPAGYNPNTLGGLY